MSGLACLINFDHEPVAPELLARMTNEVSYRGPHGNSTLLKTHAGFSFLALKTTPEAEYEQQPYVDPATGTVILFDGRVDNRDEMLKRLEMNPYSNPPVTDLDIIASAWRRWGRGFVRYLAGDFAILIWDAKQNCLYAARDPLGVRSLHYARFGKSLCVTSEARQILKHPKCSMRLNTLAVTAWAAGESANTLSMFNDIQVLPPGCEMWANADHIYVTRYWDIQTDHQIHYHTPSQYEEHFLELLQQSIQCRLRSRTGIIGTELSGGMDSSSVTALAVQLLNGSKTTLKTISYTFPTVPECDERRYVMDVARHLNIDTHFINGEESGVLDYPRGYKHAIENPWIRDNPLMSTELDYFRQTGVDVVLTGNGGDEIMTAGPLAYLYRLCRGDWRIFAEMHRDSRAEAVSFWPMVYRNICAQILPSWMDNLIRHLCGRVPRTNRSLPNWIRTGYASDYMQWKEATGQANCGLRARIQRSRYENLFAGPLPAANCVYEYLGSRHAIEIRQPFLDRRVVEFCFAIPPELWQRNGYEKWLLRCMMGERLPQSVRWRRDKSYATEVFARALHRNRYYLDEVLAYDNAPFNAVVDANVLRTEFNRHLDQFKGICRGDLDYAFSLQCWMYTNKNVLCSS